MALLTTLFMAASPACRCLQTRLLTARGRRFRTATFSVRFIPPLQHGLPLLNRWVWSDAYPVHNVVKGFEKLPQAITDLYRNPATGCKSTSSSSARSLEIGEEQAMKAWKIDHLGGELKFVDVPVPEVRPGSVLVRVEAQSLPIPGCCGQYLRTVRGET